MKKVYVVNESSHDFSDTERFGKLIFLSKGPLRKFDVNHMSRIFVKAMKDSEAGDYIVPCSLNAMNVIVAGIFASKHHRLNLLLFNPFQSRYLERIILFPEHSKDGK